MKTLTFAMIVKNAAKDLSEILPAMQSIADEMLIVDTGSSDDTIKIAQQLGAQVLHHKWNDSFAEARNVYIEAATSDWIFSIDADERVAASDLRLIKEAAGKPPQGFLMTTRNYSASPASLGFIPCRGEYADLEKGQNGWTPSTKVRMFPRLPGVRYSGAVRELLEPSLETAGIKLGEILVPIHHYGQVTEEKKAYYRDLLQKKAAEEPDNPRHLLELATENFHLKQFNDAAQQLATAIDLYLNGHKAPYFDLGGAYNTLGVALINLNRRKEALDAFDMGIRAGGNSLQSLIKNRDLLQRMGKSLGVIMIVKNEEQNLPGILNDAKRFADQIVVVDTGSQDQSVEIAKKYGAKIGHFEWCDDFAAARNRSIELAETDYLLWLDADDRIDESEQRKLQDLKSRLDGAYFLRVESATDEAAASREGFTAFYQLRLFPRRDDIRFSGRVHEELISSIDKTGLSTRQQSITIRHTGYHRAEDRIAKGRRNLAIQLKALADGNGSAEQHYMIAASYFAVKDYTKCLEHIKTARQMGGGGLWRKYAYHMACDCHINLEHPQEALQELIAGAAEYPESGLMQYFLGAMLLRQQQYLPAIEALKKAEQLGVEQESFAIPTDIEQQLPYYLGLANQKCGKLEAAEIGYRKTIGIDPHHCPALNALGITLLQRGQISQAVEYLETAHQICPSREVQSSLAGANYHLGNYDQARKYYQIDQPDASSLSGLLLCCLRLDDIDGLVATLDQLMLLSGLTTDIEIQSLDELAALIAETGSSLLGICQQTAAERMVEAAEAIKPDSSLLLQADLAASSTDKAIDLLKRALQAGFAPEKVDARLRRLEENNA